MRAIDDYKDAVAYLYENSGRQDLTVNQRKYLYESIVTAQECEVAIEDMARSILGLDGAKFIKKLKKELKEQYE